MEKQDKQQKDNTSSIIGGVVSGVGAGGLAGRFMYNVGKYAETKERKSTPEGAAAAESIINADSKLSTWKKDVDTLQKIAGDKEKLSGIYFTRGADKKWSVEFKYPREWTSHGNEGTYQDFSHVIEGLLWDDLPKKVQEISSQENSNRISFYASDDLLQVFDNEIKSGLLDPLIKRREGHLDAHVNNKLVDELKLGFKELKGGRKVAVIGSALAAATLLGGGVYLAMNKRGLCSNGTKNWEVSSYPLDSLLISPSSAVHLAA